MSHPAPAPRRRLALLTEPSRRSRFEELPPIPGDFSPAPLTDSQGRTYRYVRFSLTDHCDMACVYCMPEDVTFLDRSQLLSFEEMARFVRVAAPLGIDKIRLTGGEPLMRKELHKLVALLVAIPGIRDIGLTTNGLLLDRQAAIRSVFTNPFTSSSVTRPFSFRKVTSKIIPPSVFFSVAGFVWTAPFWASAKLAKLADIANAIIIFLIF